MAVGTIKDNKCKAVFTFLKDTKEGKYAEIDPNIVEIPRILTSRDEFLFEEEIPVLFSVTNQL